jgi:hypothetical protein
MPSTPLSFVLVTRRRGPELPQPPDLPDLLAAAPGELRARAVWDGVEAGPATVVGDWVADAHLQESRWLRADLVGRRLSGLCCRDVEFVGCDLSGALLADAELTRVTFDGCRTSGLVLSGGRLQDVRFVDCKADGIDLRMARLRRSAAQRCALRGADFYRAELTDVSLLDCDLGTASFEEVRIDRLALDGSALDDIRAARSLAGAHIDAGQVLPLGSLLVAELGFRIG